ncbi:MAG: MotA/TolQ/ExbB proton channel family protein [Deltaproteobacteria bacterium]|nr:MotA/TolQ/ExbB proton channel family protein [Deltaproteobacteria bacterium]
MLIDLLERAIEHIETGGLVMYPLLVVSIIMFFLVMKKFIEIRDFTRGDMPVLECLQSIGKPGFMAANWQMEIIKGFLSKRTFNDDLDRSILEVLRLRQIRFVMGSNKSIGILASIAPLLGLLGTVSGMITTFLVIAKSGTGDAKALASGISEALITTQTGLVVAVPGLFLANFLRRRSNTIEDRIQRFCLGLHRSHRDIDSEEG